MLGSYSKMPAGNIAPSRFVKLDPSNTGMVLQAGTNDPIFGISSPTTRRLALSGWDDGYAGILGDGAMNIIGPGDDEGLLEIAGTIAHGDYIKSDTNGKGVSAGTDKDRAGAQALQAGTSGQLIRVKPIRFDVSI